MRNLLFLQMLNFFTKNTNHEKITICATCGNATTYGM